ncbi:hypothetical protein JCM25156A_15600 [Komagataeibacter kakiaceti JCM 25156]
MNGREWKVGKVGQIAKACGVSLGRLLFGGDSPFNASPVICLDTRADDRLDAHCRARRRPNGDGP